MTKPDTRLYLGATPKEIATLADHMHRVTGIGWLRRVTDEKLMTDLRVYEAAGATLNGLGQQHRAYEYGHALRNEIALRKLWPKLPPSRRIPRCGVCSHGTERLFPTTAATHDIVSSDDESKTIYPNVCVRCWSRLHKESEETDG